MAVSALVASILVAQTTTKPPPVFDADSYCFYFDNSALKCISHRIEDFIRLVKLTKRKLDGVGAKAEDISIGTLKLTFVFNQRCTVCSRGRQTTLGSVKE